MAPTVADIVEKLRAQGVRLTIQRRLVIEALCEHGDHLSVQDIEGCLRDQGAEVNETTVYRILQWLKEMGVVSQTDLGQSEFVYQLVGNVPHHHLICLSCGTVIDVDNSVMEPLSEMLRREYGFDPRIDHMAIFGRCKFCSGE